MENNRIRDSIKDLFSVKKCSISLCYVGKKSFKIWQPLAMTFKKNTNEISQLSWRQTYAWFPLTLFAYRQRNFSHGTCAEWWNEQNRTRKDLPLCSHLKFKYFNFCEIFSQRNQSDFFLESRGHFMRIKKFLQNGCPTALWGLREDRPQYVLKTRIIELQTSFGLRQFFAETLRKWNIDFSTEIFFSDEK